MKIPKLGGFVVLALAANSFELLMTTNKAFPYLKLGMILAFLIWLAVRRQSAHIPFIFVVLFLNFLLITLISHSDEAAIQDLIQKLLSSWAIGLAETPRP